MSVTRERPNGNGGFNGKRKRRKQKRRRLKEGKPLLNSSSSSSSDNNTSGTLGPKIGASDNPAVVASDVRVKGVGCMLIRGQIEGALVIWKIDTGAKSTFISKNTYDMMVDKPALHPVGGNYVAANGQKLDCLGKAKMILTFHNQVFEHEVVVGGVSCNLIGEDFISTYRCVWDHDEASFIIKGSRIPLEGGDVSNRPGRVIALENMLVSAGHEAIIKSGVTNRAGITEESSLIGILTPERPFLEKYGLAIARTLVDAANDVVYTRVFNPGPNDVVVYKHTHMALFTPVSRIGHTFNLNKSKDPVLQVNVAPISNMAATIPEHLNAVLERGCSHLNEEQKIKFKNFLLKNQECFAKPGEVGRTHLGTHKIKLKDETPIREPPRRIPLYKRQALEEEIEKLEQRGLIEKSSSPWSSQTVMVQKKDGTWRMCIDYRKLNEKTIKDAYPLTRIDENLDALDGAEWYTSLDLDMAYHQVPMEEPDKEKTAFATPRGGLYQFTTMPFGLCNAASTFERIIEKALAGLQWQIAVLYLDDIVVFGKSFDDHFVNLEKVLSRLSEAGLKLKPKKCHFLQKEISFLGHIVSKSGIKTDPEKIKAVKSMPRPNTVTQMRSFLGLTSYYRKFIKDYSKIAKPLFDLTKKEKTFNWEEACETAFKDLKLKLITAPILAYPRAEGSEFILDTDASAYAIGAVLSQVQDGKERVIAYGSRSLDKPERNYCVTRREMLAVVYFTKYYKHYLLGRRFKLRTDHGSLTWLQNFKDPDGQIHRWIQQLSQFHMVIEHRPGARHGNADAMSRLVTQSGEICKQCEMPWNYVYDGPNEFEIEHMKESKTVGMVSDDDDLEHRDLEDPEASCPSPRRLPDISDGATPGLGNDVSGETPTLRRGRKPNRPKPAKNKDEPSIDLSLNSIREKQEADGTLKQILDFKMKDEKPKWEEISREGTALKFWLARWEILEIKNDVLCMYWEDNTESARWKICLPKILAETVLWYLHDNKTAGHVGIKKTCEKAKLSPFYWQNMQESVRNYVNKCEICGERKNPPNKKRHFMKSYVVGSPFERIATDIAGPFPITDHKNKYILVIGDYFSKLTEAYAIPDTLTTTIADILVRTWVKRYGCPLEIHSDQGRQYESAMFKEVCQLLGINKTRTTPLHPRSDGMIERMNRSINDMLSKYIKSCQRDWDLYLDFLTMAYNSTPHESTGISPHKLVYGQEKRLPLEIITEPIDENTEEPQFASDYVQELEERLRKAHDYARQHLKISAERQKLLYNARVKPKNYEVGDLVWRNQKKNTPGLKLKISRQWTGPWAVVDKFSEVIFKIQHSQKSPPVIIHGDNLKPYRGNKKLDWVAKIPRKQVPAVFPTLSRFIEDKVDQTGKQHTEKQVGGEIPTSPLIENKEKSELNNSPDVDYAISPNDSGTSPSIIRSPGVLRTRVRYLCKPLRGKITGPEHKQQTRKGRAVKIPARFKDFIHLVEENEAKMDNNNNEKHICEDCGQQYANKRNLRRHRNQVHDEQVSYVKCPELRCNKFYYRKEYLALHLECAHGFGHNGAKEKVRQTKMEKGNRSELEPRRKVRKMSATCTSSTLGVSVDGPSSIDNTEGAVGGEPPAQSKVTVESVQCVDFLEVHADSSEFDDEQSKSVNSVEQEGETFLELLDSLKELSDNYSSSSHVTSDPVDETPITSGPSTSVRIHPEDEQVAGSSGLSYGEVYQSESEDEADNNEEVEEISDYFETVETISITLITTKHFQGSTGNLLSERREHRFESSLHHDPRDLDWDRFFGDVQEEIIKHAQEDHRREAEVEELSDDNAEAE